MKTSTREVETTFTSFVFYIIIHFIIVTNDCKEKDPEKDEIKSTLDLN